MAITATFDKTVEDTLAVLERGVHDIVDVVAVRDGETVRVEELKRSRFGRKNVGERSILRATLEAVPTPESTSDAPVSLVTLESIDVEPWLWRRLVRLLDDHSLEERTKREQWQESPFSFQNMWGGAAPGDAPSDRGGIGDFFGGPRGRRAGAVQPAPEPPGAFTRAKQDGRLAPKPTADELSQ